MTTATYQPGSSGIDTYINVSTETGHGTEATLSLNTNQRILIKFDVSDISSTATCSSAVMSLYSYVTSAMTGDTWTAYPILVANSAWDEAATWNTRDGSNNWSGSAGCSTSGTDYNATAIGSCVMNETWLHDNQFSLTAATVKTWFGGSNTNYGMVIRTSAASDTGIVYSSDEATLTTNRPKLVVTYSLSGVTYRRTFSPIGTRSGSRQAT